MNTGTEQQVNQAREKVRATVTAKVNALPNLTDAQRQAVLDICLAHAVNHSGVEPSYEGIARHVRSTVKS
jgi:hypothetical protein